MGIPLQRRKHLRKIYTSLIALAFVFCVFVFSARAGTVSTSFDRAAAKTLKVLIVGSPSVGISEIAARLAAKGFSAEIGQIVAGGDGLSINKAETPLIARLRARLPMATAEPDKPDISRKTETREGVSNFSEREFYDLPPNACGYNGISFANLIRASPQND
jgi:hypothetical protein